MESVSTSASQQHITVTDATPLLDDSFPPQLTIDGVRNAPSPFCEKLVSFSRVTCGTALAGMFTGAAAWQLATHYENGDHDFGRASYGALFTLGGAAMGAYVGAAGWAVREAIRNCVNSESVHSDVEAAAGDADPHQIASSENDTHSTVSLEHDEPGGPSESPTSVGAVLSDASEEAMNASSDSTKTVASQAGSATPLSDPGHDAMQELNQATEVLGQEQHPHPRNMPQSSLAMSMRANLEELSQYLSTKNMLEARAFLADVRANHQILAIGNAYHPDDLDTINQCFEKVSPYISIDPS